MMQSVAPLLTADGSRLDWPDAEYHADVEIRANEAVVSHQLHGTPSLCALVAAGDAAWTTEVRCPRTLTSHSYTSQQARQTVPLHRTDVRDEYFLLPGLVAVRSLSLPSDGLNPFVWPPGTTVAIDAGWWLARDAPHTSKPLGAALVRFSRDSHGHLDSGEMRVAEGDDAGDPYFEITLAADLYERRLYDRDLQIAALVGACAALPTSTLAADKCNDSHPLADRLRERFEAAGLDWDDAAGFDAARAATIIEPFDVADAAPDAPDEDLP